MTQEQREAAAERLAAAREKRAKENPPAYKSIHPDVVAKPDDDPLSMKKVKEWIKYQKERKSALAKAVRANEKGAVAQYHSCVGYINIMEGYLRTSIWNGLFCGQDGIQRMKSICISMAYHHEGPMAGMAKRSVGVWYPDLGLEWTREMDEEYYRPVRGVKTSRKK